jgi:RND family efflux transporter MFP subunit
MNLPQGSDASGAARGMTRAAVVALIALLAALTWSLVSALRTHTQLRESTATQALIDVATTKPKLQSEGTQLSLPATVQANFEAPIYARTSGYLKRWQVDIGAPVRRGQLLAEIDAPEIDQQLSQAQADLATAQANRNIASLTAERWRGLSVSGSVSRQEADEKISLAASGDAQLQAALANLQRLRELSGFKRVVAPFAGVVTARNADLGQLINAGSSSGPELFRIADVRRLRVYVHVPQNYVALLQPGLVATVRFPDRPGASYEATLESTSKALDPGSRTMLAQLIIDNAQQELLPGAYAEVDFRLPLQPGSRPMKLPANVLLFRGDGLQVATVDAHNHVILKSVSVGRDYGSEVEITAGLQPDDVVILNPQDSLTDHAAVRVAGPAAARQ